MYLAGIKHRSQAIVLPVQKVSYTFIKEEPQVSFYKSCVLCPPLCTSTPLKFFLEKFEIQI